MTCHFCPNPAEHTCAWPVKRFVDVEARELEVGDLVRSVQGGRGFVVKVEECTFHVAFVIGWIDKARNHPVTRDYGYSRFTTKPLATERIVPCGVPVCFRHEREVWENRHYCREHWKQEAAA